MDNYTIITAGGIGSRMATGMPKQFLPIGGRPILMHTFDRFVGYDPDMNFVLSLPEEFIPYWKELCNKYGFTVKHEIVGGGQTRFHSIKNALEKVSGNGFTTVHDGVRPLVSINTLMHAYLTAQEYGNAVVSREIPFSIRLTDKQGSTSVDRRLYREIQTPQIFRTEHIKKAYEQEYTPLFTDDASVLEQMGEKIHLCDGNPENIKITTQTDMMVAGVLLEHLKAGNHDQ
jgi:2-C-methyl-D-erythritol 4-phosphate cytidylyltransferase